MKAIFGIGLVLLLLGILSLFLPIPHSEREGVKIGPVALQVETRRDRKLSPIVSGALILAGAAMLFAGKRRH